MFVNPEKILYERLVASKYWYHVLILSRELTIQQKSVRKDLLLMFHANQVIKSNNSISIFTQSIKFIVDRIS